MNPGTSKPTTNPIASTIVLFRKLCEGTDGDMLMNPDDLQRLWDDAVEEACIGEEDTVYWDEDTNHHLLVPGKLLLMYEDWQPTKAKDERRKDNHQPADDDQSNNSLSFNAIWCNGTIPPLKRFDIGAGGDMAFDHLTSSYERALGLLLEQTASEYASVR